MESTLLRRIITLTTLAAAGPTAAGGGGWVPASVSVPVDSPWAIAGLGALVAVVAWRVLSSRRK